jgi:hypothetical protein
MLFEPRDRNFSPGVHCFVVRQALSLQLFDNHGRATHPRPRIVKSPRATGTMLCVPAKENSAKAIGQWTYIIGSGVDWTHRLGG